MNDVNSTLSPILLRLNYLIIICLCLFCGSSCDYQKEKKNIIAKVGTESLSISEIMYDSPPQIRESMSSFEIREYALRWINNEVLYQEALNRKLEKSVDFKKEFEKIKKELLINKLIEQFVEKQITLTEGEIEKYYKNNSEEFVLSDDIVSAYHILVGTRAEANAIRARLNKKESFAEIVKDTYKDSLSTDNWDLGYFSKDEIIPEISRVVFDLPIGANSLPIKSEFGYHIVKLVDKQKKGEIKKLELVRDEIKLKLEKLKREESYQRFLLKMKSNYKIQTNFKLLDSVVLDSLIRIGD